MIPKEISCVSNYWSTERWMELNQLMAGRINWSQSCFLGNEATASSYMAYAVPSTVRIMVALYRRASAIPPFRCTGIALSSWNSFCFSGNLFSNCLREVVLMVLLAIWRSAKVTSQAALSLPSQEFNVLTLQPLLLTLPPYITMASLQFHLNRT